ncbi:hypothetical protein AX14_011282 [Amanita brunnescens Koide BX004]|nr:hypothetical protein AX14_011282 [Amanita brunnescens Koide BX004]
MAIKLVMLSVMDAGSVPESIWPEDVLWLMMASVLSTFSIKDENGVEIEIDQNAFTSGLSSSPQPV